MGNRKTGTKEWSEHSKNIQIGCENNCRYCYARVGAIRRKLVKNEKEWTEPRRNRYSQDEIQGDKFKKLDGRIMYPTTHDITGKNVETSIKYLRGWLKAGNELLIVSKPKFSVIKHLLEEIKEYQDQVTLRFTIGTMNDECLEYWEPNAPRFAERLASLKYARSEGWETSVSIEPMLFWDTFELVVSVFDHITDSIWIGTMNRKEKRWVKEGTVRDGYWGYVADKIAEKEYIEKNLFNKFRDCPKVHWKDQIKEMFDLEEEPIG